MKLLRAFFLLLVAANLMVFGYAVGYFGRPPGGSGESERLVNQLAPERIRIVGLGNPMTLVKAAPTTDACREFAGLSGDDAAKLAELVQPRAQQVRLTRRESDGQASHWVFIPTTGKADAERQVAQLKRLNITDHFIVQEPGPNQFMVSLGLFRSEQSAATRLQELKEKGIDEARTASRDAPRREAVVQISGPADIVAMITRQAAAELPSLKTVECHIP